MSEPLALVPLAVAARGGRVDSLDARQLVAAGLTLLQRCAPLVRALSGKRAAVLLPNSGSFLLALAACDGRGAVVLHPAASQSEIERMLAAAGGREGAGAVFTVERLAESLPDHLPRVLLDVAPGHAVFIHGSERRTVDLGSHVGLAIEGEGDVVGREEEAVLLPGGGPAGLDVLSHRALLQAARTIVAGVELSAADHALAALPFSHPLGLTASLFAPLLAGARVTTMERFSGDAALEVIEGAGITLVSGGPRTYDALLTAIGRRRAGLRAPALRIALWGGGQLPAEVRSRWQTATGVALREASGIVPPGSRE